MVHLLLITNCFPWSGYTEGAFIQPELDALCDAFYHVVIIPDHVEEKHINQLNIINVKYQLDSEYLLKKRSDSLLYLLKYLFYTPVLKAIKKDWKSIISWVFY